MSKAKSAGSVTTAATASHSDFFSIIAWRETVESIVVAVILAFLFRTFVAEAFVIPTGSMAPTLQGTHKDVTCEQCEYAYRAGASIENEENGQSFLGRMLRRSPAEREQRALGVVTHTKCPICGFSMAIDTSADWNHKSFNGDRILVSKFDYDLHEPQRWDVIVFKYPQNAKQNYIKRLVGLPNEKIKIEGGDIHIQRPGEVAFRIERKPDHKLLAMLQVVDDTRYIAGNLASAGWPSRWQPWAPGAPTPLPHPRSCADDTDAIRLGGGSNESWLRYRHLMPTDDDWERVAAAASLDAVRNREGELIADFYAYNAYTGSDVRGSNHIDGQPGVHWVGDLALECDAEIEGSTGQVLLDLVEGGEHFTCRIDVASGEAALTIRGATARFENGGGRLIGTTPIRGSGRYHLRFANVDDELRLWVDDERVTFEAPTTYTRSGPAIPTWTPTDPGDAAPLGVGCNGVAITLHELRVLRDIFYIASTHSPGRFTVERLVEDFRNPASWSELTKKDGDPDLRARWRNQLESSIFELNADQFFPLGDNSPFSADARHWKMSSSPEPGETFVKRKLLVGKALLIYWPHSWNSPPFLPNFRRMGLIR